MKRLFVFVVFLGIAQFLPGQKLEPSLVVPIGHTEGITSVDVSPDGRFILTGSLDRTVKIWDRSGHEIRALLGHSQNVLSVAFSPRTSADTAGGHQILSGGTDNKAILWDKFGKKIAEYKGPMENGEVNAVAFSPDGQELLLGLKDGTARLLDLNCREKASFQHSAAINAVSFSPDGKYILTASDNKIATLWAKNSPGKPVSQFSGHQARVTSLAFSVTGDSILTGSADKTAILWKTRGGKIRSFEFSSSVNAVSFDRTGRVGMMGCSNGMLHMWPLAAEDFSATKIFSRELSSLRRVPGTDAFVTASSVGSVAMVVDGNGQWVKQLKGRTSAITSLAVSSDGQSLLVGHADSTVKMWDLAEQKVATLQYPEKPESVAFSPKNEEDTIGGKYYLVACADKVCRVHQRSVSKAHTISRANQGVFSSDGRTVVTANPGTLIQCWRLGASQHEPLPFSGQRITSLAFSPSKAFAVGTEKGELIYWDSLAAAPATIRLSTASLVNALAFSPDGKWVVCGIKGGLTEIVDIANKKVAYSNRPRNLSFGQGVAFFPPNPQGGSLKVLRAAGADLDIWDLGTNSVKNIKAHISDVTAVAFSPDGTMFYSGGSDGALKVWDAASGKELATLVSIDTADWAITTPNGIYDASSDAMKSMHYVLGMDVVLLRQIKERYWDPGLLSKVTGVSAAAVRDVPELSNVDMYPEIEANISAGKLHLKLLERNGGLGRLSLYINGKCIENDLNPSRQKTLPPIDLNNDRYMAYYRGDTMNTIGLVAYNSGNWLRSQVYELTYRPFSSRGDATGGANNIGSDCKSTEPKLYVISIGTSKYLDDTKSLAYPDYDAESISKALASTGKAMFKERVQVKLLSTAGNGIESPSKANIKKAFMDVAASATPCDVLVVYFSGHGKTWGTDAVKSNFYYLTKDISSERLHDKGIREAHAISDVELEDWFNQIRALKQVLIIDACESGKLADNMGVSGKDLNSTQAFAMGILNDRTGALILTSSLSEMLSYESSKFGQGLLTYSLLRGMTGPGLSEGRLVDVMTLFLHARNEVPKLAESIRQKQTPVIASEGDSFPIGIKDETVQIVVGEEKPIFIQSKFIMDGHFFRDSLGGKGIGQALNDYFFAQRLKGPAAKYVYYDTQALADGYCVLGKYSISGANATVTANLYRGEKPVGEPFTVTVPSNLDAVTKSILKEVLPRVK